MIRRVLRFLLSMVAVVLLAVLCWLFAVFHDWSVWQMLLMWLGILAGGAAALWAWRRWRTWRLKRRLAREMTPQGRRADHAAFDRQWRAGLDVLRQFRHGSQAGSARRLPWMLVLDLHDVPTKGLAALAVKSLPGRTDAQAGAATPGWYFLRRSVMLHAGRDMVLRDAGEPDSTWRRLLYSLNRLSRQEPINGVVLRVDAGRLAKEGDQALAELGRSVRARIDELSQVMEARMPVWLVLTGGQALPGLQDWALALDENLRDAAVGATLAPDQRDRSVAAGIRQMFAGLNQRLFELRVAQGMHGALAPAVFDFPLQMQRLEEPVQRMLSPAFDASPYAPAPLLQGLYLTAQGGGEDQWAPWFSPALYDTVLPAQRDAWLPLERWRQSRRLARRTAVALWLALCTACAFAMFYSWRQVSQEIVQLEKRPLEELSFEGGLEGDLQALHVWRDATAQLLQADDGWRSHLPLMNHLTQLHDRYRQQFARIYRKEILVDHLNPLLGEALPAAAQRGQGRELAAWAQHLTRRINLIQARLDGRSLDKLPLPGSELREIYLADGQPAPGPQAAALTGQLYRDYLLWQPELARLRGEQESLRAALLQLGLGSRQPDWLLAWADLQGDLRPVALSDFWMIPYDPAAPQIPAGLTPAGAQAIRRFVDEMSRAMPQDGDAWQSRHAELAERFLQASFDAWYRFADSVPDARRQLPDEQAWRNHLANIMTGQDPHLMVMRQIAALFDELPEESRPDWIAHVIELDRLLQAAQAGADGDGVLGKAQVLGSLGGAPMRSLAAGASLGQSADQLQRGLDTVGDMRVYRQGVLQAAQQNLQGSAGAVKLAIETWSFGRDPSVQAGPLLQAQQLLDMLQQRLGSSAASDSVVWDLLRGPLLLALDYSARATACELQSRWESEVLGAIQGVGSAALADELLYGERGQVPAFLQGDVKYFVERDALRYRPREVLDMAVPLNGQFYAFASMAQQQQVRRMQAGQQEAIDQKRQQVDLQTLQEDIVELEKQQALMRASVARVRISGEPPLVNPGARILPQQTGLTLQCAEGPTSIQNFNFPVSKLFAWSAQSCTDAVLEIRFPTLTLRKTYAGPYGFADFLAEFADGRRSFTPDDFPSMASTMRSHGLETLTVRWQLQDAQAVQGLADGMQQVAGQIAERQTAIRDAREREVRQAQQQLSRAANPDAVPARIAGACWQPVSSSKAYADVLGQAGETGERPAPAAEKAAASGAAADATTPAPGARPAAGANGGPPAAGQAAAPGWLVQVGVFASTEKARSLLDTLGIPHYEEAFSIRGSRSTSLVIAGPFDSRERAQAEGRRIDEALALKTRVVRRR